VPEVDVVISISPDALLASLQGRWSQGGGRLNLDVRKLQKSAIRACTDRLVGVGGFKFRRSSFRDEVPKVIVIAPAALGIYDKAVPLTISVNAVTPLYNTALLTEMGQIDARARDLVLLVKRWAKDRGLCHSSRGHLSPYAWTLLTIYFLQVFESEEEKHLLPSLEDFKVSSGLMKRKPEQQATVQQRMAAGAVSSPNEKKHSTSSLFQAFMHFYAQSFDWRNEAVSVKLGKRAPPDLKLPLHVIVSDDGTTQVGPSIEDPFEPGQNIGACTTAESLTRLREEFTRAETLCLEEASLTSLLEPWAPAATGQGGEEQADDKEES
jgi:DNA polymerase sigma